MQNSIHSLTHSFTHVELSVWRAEGEAIANANPFSATNAKQWQGVTGITAVVYRHGRCQIDGAEPTTDHGGCVLFELSKLGEITAGKESRLCCVESIINTRDLLRPPPRKAGPVMWQGLSVCLSGCRLHNSKSYEGISRKIYGVIDHSPSRKRLDFGGDSDSSVDSASQSMILHH